MECSACGEIGTSNDSVLCCKCNKYTHMQCMPNLTREESRNIRLKKPSLCPSCKAKSQVPKTDTTPVTPNSPKHPEEAVEAEPESDFLSSAQRLASLPIPAEAMVAFTSAIKDLCNTFSSMKEQISEFTRSLNHFSADLTSFKEELASLKKQQKETDKIKTDVVNLRAEVAELREIIAVKDQRQLLKNVEISGLPESRSENLYQIINVMSSKLGIQLNPLDIDDVKRVGTRREGAQQRPRPAILTFTRRAPRDQLLKAARVRRGLTSDTLDIPGPSTRVYLKEHVSKANRILYSKARKLGSELHYKYTWTSNGNIFMRRSDTSSVTHVTSEAVLDKLSQLRRPTKDSLPAGNPPVEQSCS